MIQLLEIFYIENIKYRIWHSAEKPNLVTRFTEKLNIRIGFCSNMDLSDHAYILHTEVFEGEKLNEKILTSWKLTVVEIIELKINEFP